MTTSQLRQWSLHNSQPDQWWLSFDSVIEEIPLTAADIADRLRSGKYSTVQALHVSQADLENPQWIEVENIYAKSKPSSLKESSSEVTVEAPSKGKKQSITASIPPWAKRLIVCSLILIALAVLYAMEIYSLMVCIVSFGLIISCSQIRIGALKWGLSVFLLPFLVFSTLYFFLADISLVDRWNSMGNSKKSNSNSAGLPVGEYEITGDNFTGFTNRKDEERATELASDEEAFNKFFAACVTANRATLFEKGETVILEEFGGFADRLVKLRRKGELVSYWTNREAIDE